MAVATAVEVTPMAVMASTPAETLDTSGIPIFDNVPE
jgi:hypothetical protein